MLVAVLAAFGGEILFTVLGIIVAAVVFSLVRWLLAFVISFDEEEH